MIHGACLLLATILPGQTEEPALVRMHFEGAAPLFSGVRASLLLEAVDGEGATVERFDGSVRVEGLLSFETRQPIERAGPFAAGKLRLDNVLVAGRRIAVRAESGRLLGEAEPSLLPGFLTLLPPLLAIILALATRQVLLALFVAVWVGSMLSHGVLNPLEGFLRVADVYLVGALADTDHAYIILFSLALAGMVGVITASGGIRGVVEAISRLATGRRSGQVSTWLLGVLIFFDDYANSLIVGNTMRPFTDRVRISREKLSFIVDSTAAPVATIGVISTWTAYQTGLVADVLFGGEGDEATSKAYSFFLRSIPYSFYSLLMILFVFLCGAALRDFGPMRRAERRCRETGKVLSDRAQPLLDENLDRLAASTDVPARWYNAAVPVACVVGFTVVGLVLTGRDAFRSLLWAALGASVVAIALAVGQRRPLSAVMMHWVDGARSLVLAIMILVLAWSVSAVCTDLNTGDYVVSVTRGLLSPRLIPALTFVTAGVIAFATGTSYGTMAILMPILLPLASRLGGETGLEATAVDQIVLATLAAILGGAVYGDHCSPISDTTVLSSMASGADHIDHVRTQLPYACVVALVALPCYLLVGLGTPVALVLVLGAAALAGLFFLAAKPTD